MGDEAKFYAEEVNPTNIPLSPQVNPFGPKGVRSFFLRTTPSCTFSTVRMAKRKQEGTVRVIPSCLWTETLPCGRIVDIQEARRSEKPIHRYLQGPYYCSPVEVYIHFVCACIRGQLSFICHMKRHCTWIPTIHGSCTPCAQVCRCHTFFGPYCCHCSCTCTFNAAL